MIYLQTAEPDLTLAICPDSDSSDNSEKSDLKMLLLECWMYLKLYQIWLGSQAERREWDG